MPPCRFIAVARLWIVIALCFCICRVFWGQRLTDFLIRTEDYPTNQSSIPTTRHENSLHFAEIENLGLMDWEEESLQGIVKINATEMDGKESCMPPDGISTRCCVGTFSSGGSVNPTRRHLCSQALREGLPFVEATTRKFMEENYIGNHETERCDVCRIIEIARKHNLSLVFLGDSMQTQVFQGIVCEIQRRNYDVWTNSTNWKPKNPWSNSKISLSETARIRSKSWDQDEVVEMKFFMVYMIHFAIEQQRLLIMNSGNIFIFGFGLHWKVRSNIKRKAQPFYISVMSDLFRNASKLDHVRLVIHRETSAQHFNSPGGLYELQDNNSRQKFTGCVPIEPSEDMYWRFDATKEAARLAGLDFVVAGPHMPPPKENKNVSELIYLPYFNYTSQLYNQHIRGKDCTHYCSTPFVYLPLWRMLRLTLDREFMVQQ